MKSVDLTIEKSISNLQNNIFLIEPQVNLICLVTFFHVKQSQFEKKMFCEVYPKKCGKKSGFTRNSIISKPKKKNNVVKIDTTV